MLKSKRSTAAGSSRGGRKSSRSIAAKALAGKVLYMRLSAVKTNGKRRALAPAETIEARLERKATVADTRTFAAKSLGQMSREQRHKLLYGD